MSASSSRPRLWMVVPQVGRPSEVWLRRQVEGIAGFDVTVVSLDASSAGAWEPACEVRSLGVADASPSGVGRWAWRASRAGHGNYFSLPAGEARKFADALAADRPDAVLCQFGLTALRVERVLAAARVPAAVHFHGVDISRRWRDRWYRASWRRAQRTYRQMVVVNRVQAGRLRALGVADERVHVIPCGVPIEPVPRERAVDASPCEVLMVGRLTAKKAPLLALRAFAAARETAGGRAAGMRLELVGDGEMSAAVEAEAMRLGRGDAVRRWGALPADRVRELMGSCQVFLQHSVTSAEGDEEGWPVAVAEAMSAGMAVVATRHTGIGDQIEDSRSGLLVDEHDEAGTAAALARLAGEPGLRASLGAAARERIAQVGDVDRQVAALEAVLREAMADR